jgi:hypothetical protein
MQSRPGNSGSDKRFCTQCGNSLAVEDNFCGSCGHPSSKTIQPSATQPDLPSAAPPQPEVETLQNPVTFGETVTGALLASRKKGMFSIESFHIILTSERVICAAFTNEMVKQAAKEAGQTGFLAGMAAAATVGYTYYKKYLAMDPESALKENPQNFAFPVKTIQKTRFEMGARHRDPKTKRETWDESKLEIETTGEKYSFKVAHQLHDQAWDVLSKGRLV